MKAVSVIPFANFVVVKSGDYFAWANAICITRIPTSSPTICFLMGLLLINHIISNTRAILLLMNYQMAAFLPSDPIRPITYPQII